MWAENPSVHCILIFALPKWSINPFQQVWQSRQHALRAYSPNLYTVQLQQLWQTAQSQELLQKQCLYPILQKIILVVPGKEERSERLVD